MNCAIFVVLALFYGVGSRPVGQEVLAGEDFLAFLMRSHRGQETVHHRAPATTTTEPGLTETETTATALETEPPSVVSVRVSSSVRKEALHENSIVPAASTRSHFGVDAAVFRAAEDSIAEETRHFPAETKKPYAEALTLQESGLGYESRVSSETSQSRVYVSSAEPVEETVVVQTSRTSAIVVPPRTREETKYTAGYGDRIEDDPGRQYSTQVSQSREERQYDPRPVNIRQQFSNQPIIGPTKEEARFEAQKIMVAPHRTPIEQQELVTQEPVTVTQEDGQYRTNPQVDDGQYRTQAHHDDGQYRPQTTGDYRAERHYEQAEQNYEVDEAISVMTNGRTHGVQTERPRVGQVQEGANYRKYRVEEKTPDGFIVGEYGVVSHDDGGVRGVRYTADGSISPRLIYEALVKFLSLK